jgi:hypothetical protein
VVCGSVDGGGRAWRKDLEEESRQGSSFEKEEEEEEGAEEPVTEEGWIFLEEGKDLFTSGVGI